ncbi:hypothetical protein [Aureispira sp. CCB-QB1]|uniref:hypothetical protein n=1 Tax=Aureispira sp. CCB-QB1 TaxID=1313421 RepID=UPI0012DD344B|nr:hypothetical protein [Aureispira sp. CCB-QB1]
MSMWEIEALIEEAVRLIDKSQKEKKYKRSIIWNLYEIQGQFDCSFTNFRVIQLLLKNGYTKTIQIEEHPSFSKHTAYFDALKTKEFEFIHVNVDKVWSSDNPVAAYWDQKSKSIYYDFGSPLWDQLEEDSPQEFDLYDLSLEIILEAHEQKDKNRVYDWTAFLINYGLNFFKPNHSIDFLKETYFRAIKAIFQQYDFSSYKAMHPSLEIMEAPLEWLGEEENDFLQWFNSQTIV